MSRRARVLVAVAVFVVVLVVLAVIDRLVGMPGWFAPAVGAALGASWARDRYRRARA